jgi:hypothetical protein
VSDASPLGSATGGFAAVLALAVSSDDFASVVDHYMTVNGMAVIEVEDVEPFAERMRTGAPDLELVKDANALSSAAPVLVGMIDSYTEDAD